MIQLADFKTGLPNCEKSDSPILRYLIAVQAFAHLEGEERERLDSARWLLKRGSGSTDRSRPSLNRMSYDSGTILRFVGASGASGALLVPVKGCG